MFEPRYIITGKILKSLVDWEKAGLVVEMAPVQSDWETKLKQEALARRASAVLKYVETDLGADDITKIIKDDPGRDDKPTQVALRCGVVAKERDLQMAINWLNANKLVEQTAYLSKKFKQGGFEYKDLEAINSLLGERIVPSTELNQYREGAGEEIKGLICPPTVEIPYQIDDLFAWFKSSGRAEIHPLFRAATMLFELIRIQPFKTNNVLTSLFFSNLILISEGYQFKGIWAPEEEILKNKQKMMEVVMVGAEGGDLTGWFEYVSSAMAGAAEKTRVKIMNLVGEGPIFKTESGRAISLTERQIGIMEEMTIRNEMTIKEVRAILPMVSDDTILRDLKDLMTKKLIRKKGKTKGAVYVLGKAKGFR